MKKMLIIFLIFILMMPSAFAARETAVLPSFTVTLNGEKVENEYRQFPLLVYKDITYLPMTYYDCRFMGLSTAWDMETGTLLIDKENRVTAYRDYKWQWKNADTCEVSLWNIVGVKVNGKQQIDNLKEEYPILIYRDVTYFPLTWRFAVEEFGWDYHFDLETGLTINSDGYIAESLDLPNVSSGMVATDGSYYYYNGTSGDKNVIYRIPVSGGEAQIIHELPDTDVSKRANFVESGGDVYIKYSAGSGAIMSTEYSYKIESDGTLTAQKPGNYSGGKHGKSESTAEKDGIFVRFNHEYFDAASEITYTLNGVETLVEPLPGRVQIGRKRDGKQDYNTARHDYIQIHDGKIYFTGVDLATGDDSALYVIDTVTGKAGKLIDGVWGYHVYTGWLNEENSNSTMILYDNNGYLMRYSELNGDIRQIETKGEEGLNLENATGDYNIYTVQKTIDGRRTVIKNFDCYASGTGSITGSVLLDTTAGTYTGKYGEKIGVFISGEPADQDVRTFILDKENRFCSSDVANSVFICGDTLLYRTGYDISVKVDLK